MERNWQALALARESVEEVPLQPVNPHSANRPPVVSDAAPDFVKTVTAAMLAGLGDALPVSALPPDGTGRWALRAGKNAISPKRSPSGKRNSVPNVTTALPLAHTQLFAQKWCRLKRWKTPPASLHSLDVKSRDMRGQKYVLQVAPEDCTGCNLCVEVCPAKDRQNPEIKAINMMSRTGTCRRRENQLRFLPQPARNRP